MDWKEYESNTSALWSDDAASVVWHFNVSDKECQTEDGIWHDDAEIIMHRLSKLEVLLIDHLQRKSWWHWFTKLIF